MKPGTVVAVDFDGTCVTHEYPNIGRFVGAQRVLHRIVAEGGKLILWTMRSGEKLREALDWFAENQITLYGVQCNPEQISWTESPKAYAQIYIDDAALGCPLKPGLPGERPFVDWVAIERLLWPTTRVDPPNPSGYWEREKYAEDERVKLDGTFTKNDLEELVSYLKYRNAPDIED